MKPYAGGKDKVNNKAPEREYVLVPATQNGLNIQKSIFSDQAIDSCMACKDSH